MKNFEEWWNKIGSGIVPGKNDDMESHAKKIAKSAIFAMNEELFVRNKKVTNLMVLGDNKKPDNYRAEGWYQLSRAISNWIGNDST